MKKRLIFAVFAAVVTFASCKREPIEHPNQNEEPIIVENADSPVFTATIAGSSKTTIDVSNGKIAWEKDDEITVTDASAKSAVYIIESIDPVTGKATFVIKQGQSALGEGPYSANYGAAPTQSQTYSKTAGDLPMAAPATSDNNFVFTVVQCGLMWLKLTQTGEDVKSIAVTGTPEGGTQTTFTLNCEQAQSIESPKDFYISLPQGEYTKIVITDSRGWECTKTVKSTPLKVLTNHIKPVTFKSLDFIKPAVVIRIFNEYVNNDAPSPYQDIWGIQW